MENAKVDCCFVITLNSALSYQGLSKDYSAIEPPTWALLLAQSARAVENKVNILSGSDRMAMGGGQIICRDPETGIISAGSEPRKDGAAVGW